MAIAGDATTARRRANPHGMVGGGQGAFIGAVHRIAARMDDQYELVAGALSSDPEARQGVGQELGLADDRTYSSFEEMAKARGAARRTASRRSPIVTPNHMHAPVAKAFLKAGIHVICDKPLTTTLKEAKELVELAEEDRQDLRLTHNYTGYPMVRQARDHGRERASSATSASSRPSTRRTG